MSESQPTILPFNADGLPLADLREYPHAITWQYEWKEDRWTKVPRIARTGELASSTNSKTWCPVDDVLAKHDRLGYIMSPDNPFTFIDLDNSGDYETQTIKPWAQEVVDHFPNAYWEWSPSGTGLKGLVRGRVPENRSPRYEDGKIEAFSTNKYTTLTGHRITASATSIGDGQEGIDWLYATALLKPKSDPIVLASLDLEDEEIIERVERMSKGYRLYRNGDVGDYDGDDSEADLGLLDLFIIAGATDAYQLDRLFRSSALVRPKWDRASYREPTIRRALDGTVRPGDWNGQKSRVVIGKSQDAILVGGDLPETIEACHAVIRALQKRVATAERIAREAKAKAREMQELHQNATRINGNPHLGQERFTATAVIRFLKNREESTDEPTDDGMWRVPLESLSPSNGFSGNTISKHITKLEDETGGLLRKETRWINEKFVDPITGEIHFGRNATFIGTNGGGVKELEEALVAYTSEKPKAWGGDRKRQCPDHPSAPIIKRTTYLCEVCHTEVDRDPDQHIKPDKNGTVIGKSQDAILVGEGGDSTSLCGERITTCVSDVSYTERLNADERWDA